MTALIADTVKTHKKSTLNLLLLIYLIYLSSIFWLQKDQLWKQISQVLLGFCSAYIYSFKKNFGQLFSGVFKNVSGFSVFELEKKSRKFYEIILKTKLSWTRTKIPVVPRPLDVMNIICQDPFFPTKENFILPSSVSKTEGMFSSNLS
jgi:hypothetical protein